MTTNSPWGVGGSASTGEGTGGPLADRPSDNDEVGCRFNTFPFGVGNENDPPTPTPTYYKLTECDSSLVKYTAAGLTANIAANLGKVVELGEYAGGWLVETTDSHSGLENLTITASHVDCDAYTAATEPDPPSCPGSYWAVRFVGVTLCSCQLDGSGGSYRVTTPIPNVWICMEAGVENEIDFGPEAYPDPWGTATHYSDTGCTTSDGTSGLTINMISGGGMVAVELSVPINGGPGASVGVFPATSAPSVGNEVTINNTNSVCAAGPGAVIGTGGSVIVRKLA